jgi:signal transduction histidine kinase
MTRLRRSLRTRLVVVFGATFVLMQLANAAYLLLASRRAGRLRLESTARQYAAIATPVVAQSFDSYFNSGYFKFRQLVIDLLGRSEDVTAILICDVEGRVLFDSRRMESTPVDASVELPALNGERLAAVRRVQPSEIEAAAGDAAPLEIVVPYLEDWGRHRLSVIYHVSHARLDVQFRSSVRLALELVALTGVLVSLLGLALSTSLTRPLAALTRGVQQVAAGHYDQRLQVRSGDELQLVADAFNDMTSRLQQTIGEMERRNEELERFTYTVSHDLRTPLVTVSGFLGLLDKDLQQGRTDRARQDLARIRRAADTMDRLLRELLDLSRVGRVTNPPEDVPLRSLAEEAQQSVAGRLAAAHVEFAVEPELPVLYGDRARLQEVVRNLVDNAAKFMGRQEHPRVVVGARPGAHGPVWFVRDNGIGIDPKHHQRVFGLFERLDPAVEGTGIGLALVKRIIEVHGGRVWVESEGPGQGTSVCVSLPPRPVVSEERLATAAATHGPDTSVTTGKQATTEA